MAKSKGNASDKAVSAKSGGGTKASSKPEKKVGPVEFVQQTRQEAAKVTWTSWDETWKTSLMVLFVMVLFGAFFFATDTVIGGITEWALALGSDG